MSKSTKNYIKNYWEYLEKETKPVYAKKIQIIDKKTFDSLFINSNSQKNKIRIKKIVKNLYKGHPYIIKKVISKNFIEKLKSQLVNISANSKSSFYKMNFTCPNFWRRQSERVANKYSVKAVRDSYYFFRWNKENQFIWKNFDGYWSKIKYLGGLSKNSYKKNLPKDGVVDRIQIVRYPEDTGFIEPHFHDPKNQRIIISIYMSKKGDDYVSGGTSFFNGNKKIDAENKIDVGDIGLFYATLKHTVDSVKKSNKKINKKFQGRWWCGLYSPESDLVKNRHTSSPSK